MFDFDLLRWMRREDETDSEFKNGRSKMDMAYVPFGYGNRACIRGNVVTLELYKIWATMVRLYQVSSISFHFCSPLDSPLTSFAI